MPDFDRSTGAVVRVEVGAGNGSFEFGAEVLFEEIDGDGLSVQRLLASDI